MASRRRPRRPQERKETALSTKSLALYHFESCPFCARVRQAMEGIDAQIELRDIELDAGHREDLAQATGRHTVPCLRIEDEEGGVTWMHESADIISYLEEIAAA